MSGRVNGGRTRMLDLEAARRTSRRLKPSTLSPDEASILIDSVLLRYGMDPTLWTDLSGWRHLMIGSAEGFAGVVEWQPDDYYLVVLAPLLEIPEEFEQLTGFYQMLLELNYHGTLSAHFSINEGTLYLGITRPIRSLDEEEVDEAIHTVMILADSYDDRLKELINLIPLSMPQLPDIKMRPQDAQIIGATLAACDSYGQTIFRFLMERWEALGYIVDASTTGIALSFLLGDQPYAIAALHPGFAERRQEVILGWEGLRRKREFPEEAIEKFQSDVTRNSEIRTTANTAHIEVTEIFDEEKANTLLKAMGEFADAIGGETDIYERLLWDPQLPSLQVAVDIRTSANIQETLKACDPRVQRIYSDLIQGWYDSGGEVECVHAGRIYLKLVTGRHEVEKYGVLSHRFNLAALTTPTADLNPSIDLAWNLASGLHSYLEYIAEDVGRYETVVSGLPGFVHEGSFTRIMIDDSFSQEHSTKLLEAMLKLKSAAGNVE